MSGSEGEVTQRKWQSNCGRYVEDHMSMKALYVQLSFLPNSSRSGLEDTGRAGNGFRHGNA